MAKELFNVDDVLYFLDEDSGKIFKVDVKEQISPSPKVIAAAIKAHDNLCKRSA
jgi:hypothetical protein